MAKRTFPVIDFDNATREELIDRIRLLEKETTNETEIELTRKEKKRKNRDMQPFDFDAYPKKHLALKVAYLGWDYHGFASQISFKSGEANSIDCKTMSTCPTIEVFHFISIKLSHVFHANSKINPKSWIGQLFSLWQDGRWC
jgi:hypothetical protein